MCTRLALRRSSFLHRLTILLAVAGLLLPPAGASATSAGDPVDRILNAMSVEQRVGQLFMVDFYGTDTGPNSRIAQLIRDYNVGAVYLNWGNANIKNDSDTPMQVARLTNSLQDLACTYTALKDVAECVPLFIAIDHEGDGYPRTHFREGTTAIPSAMAIGATWSTSDAQAVGKVVGQELAAAGVNLLLGPVVDVLEQPRPEGNGDMGIRVFGGDPGWVGTIARAYIQGVHEGGSGRVLTVAKHFPGHGASDRNPDQEVSTVAKSLEELKRSDLVPFFTVTSGADTGTTDGLMPSHIRYRGFQGDVSQLTRPISLDPDGMAAFMSLAPLATWRQNGLIVSDGLGVRAVQAYYDPTLTTFAGKQIAKDALLAGNDLLPILGYALEPGDTAGKQLPNMIETITYFREEYRANGAFRARVDDALRHILQAKLKISPDLTARQAHVDVTRASATVGKGDAAMRGVLQDALTLVYPPGVPGESGRRLPAVPHSGDDILILGCFRGCLPGPTMGETEIQDTIMRLYGPAGSGQVDPARIHTIQFDKLDALMSDSLPPDESDALRQTIDQADWIVLGIIAYLPDAIPASAAYKRFLRDRSFDLRGKKLVGIAYGPPYNLDATEMGKLTAYLSVYSKVPAAVEASVRALFGELAARGSSPVSVPGASYDLAAQLQPDPNQRVTVNVPAGIDWKVGSSLTVQAGPFYDRNGRLVRDGTAIDFGASYRDLGVTLAPQIITPTQSGIASATFRPSLAGTLDLAVQGGGARSEPVRLTVGPAVATQPAKTPQPGASPTHQPPAAISTPSQAAAPVAPELSWWGLWVAVVLLGGGALIASLWMRRKPAPATLDITARGGPSVDQAPGVALTPEERVILRQAFIKYSRVTVDAEFRSGYSGAHTLLVLPVKSDGRADAYAIAKIAPQPLIRQELRNYETFVKDTLPPVTARIEDTPVLPEGQVLGALRYTFVGQLGAARTQSLHEFAAGRPADEVAGVIENKLFEVFGRNWWMQRRPYSFRLGQEYEPLLPVNLLAEAGPVSARPHVTLIAGAREWPDLRGLMPGQVVRLEGFAVKEISADGQTMTLGLPDTTQRHFRVRVQAGTAGRLPPLKEGAKVPSLTATITATRTTLLESQVRKGFPHVRALDTQVSLDGGRRLPNPLNCYTALLDERVFGTLSTIHGDLNLENILIDPGGYTWLIDFALTRDGHTLYDFARLETELLTRHIAPRMAAAGLGPGDLVCVLDWLKAGDIRPGAEPGLGHPVLDDAARVLAAVRRIVNRCLFDAAHPEEYTRALMLCQLGSCKFANLDVVREAPLPKQLAFVAAAYMAGAETRE